MRPRELQIDPINRNCTEFRGVHIREVYTRLFKRPPTFNTRTRSWSAPPAKVADLAALCESLGWLVTYSQAPVSDETPVRALTTDRPDPARGLW